MGCTFFWVKIDNAFANFVYWAHGAMIQYKYLNSEYLIARCNCALASKQNIFLCKKVSMAMKT